MRKIVIGAVIAAGVLAIAVVTRTQIADAEVDGGAPTVAAAPAASAEQPSPRASGPSKTVEASADPAPERTPDAAPERETRAPDRSAAQTAPTAPAAEERNAKNDPSDRTPTQEPEAEDVLRRAAAAYADVRTLEADFVQRLENRLLGDETVSRGTLYQRYPGRFLMRFSEPEGDVIVSDGRYFWVYYPSVNAKQVIRMPAAPGRAGGADLRAQFIGDPLERFEATLEGEAVVDGRQAYVLTLVPNEDLGYERLKVWVDAKDSLVRRFVITQSNGNVRRFDLSDLEVNQPLSDELFEFTPPEGARIVDQG